LGNARALIASGVPFSSANTYATSAETRVVYGIDTGPIRMPFNRADYFVDQPSASDMPKRCAPGTGILYKAVVNHADGGFSYLPLLDCVADMQVIFRWTNNSGALSTINVYEDISALPGAFAIRSQVNEVRVFILAHEGQRDPAYQHPVSTVDLGDNGIVKHFDLTTTGIGWQNYRWKVYTLVVRLNNLNW
jgi:hypothetical protein